MLEQVCCFPVIEFSGLCCPYG